MILTIKLISCHVVEHFPKFTQIPTISWRVERKSTGKPEIVFTCDLPNSGLLAGDVLDVEWYTMRPGEHSQRIFPPGGQRQIIDVTETAELHEDDYYTIQDALQGKRGPLGSFVSIACPTKTNVIATYAHGRRNRGGGGQNKFGL